MTTPIIVTVEKGNIRLRYTFTNTIGNVIEVTYQENDEKPYVAAQYSDHSIYASYEHAVRNFDAVLKALI